MIKIRDLSISFSGHQIFEDVNVTINYGDKVGFIGRNGSGKSTFLKLILNKLEPDSGEIEIPKGYKIGHLEQHIKFHHKTVTEEVCSVLPPEREYEGWKGEEILLGLGFSSEDMMRNPAEFSGGYQVKINLAKLLLDEPNMLLLDEPTNYLDIHSVRWLKKFLQDWDRELILITHDRDFMDSVINQTLNIHRGNFKKLRAILIMSVRKLRSLKKCMKNHGLMKKSSVKKLKNGSIVLKPKPAWPAVRNRK